MDKDEWDQWKENPITRWVLQALETAAQHQEAAWREASWVKGEADALVLTELRTRADAYRALAEMDYERVRQINDSTD